MYKTSVYTLVNGDMQMSDTSKTAKITKRWYHSPSHRLIVNVLFNKVVVEFWTFFATTFKSEREYL